MDSDEYLDNPDWSSFMVLMMNEDGSDHVLLKTCVQNKHATSLENNIAFVITSSQKCSQRIAFVQSTINSIQDINQKLNLNPNKLTDDNNLVFLQNNY